MTSLPAGRVHLNQIKNFKPGLSPGNTRDNRSMLNDMNPVRSHRITDIVLGLRQLTRSAVALRYIFFIVVV